MRSIPKVGHTQEMQKILRSKRTNQKKKGKRGEK